MIVFKVLNNQHYLFAFVNIMIVWYVHSFVFIAGQ